jgi:DNA-binding FrmR family transcriptional regulator
MDATALKDAVTRLKRAHGRLGAVIAMIEKATARTANAW